MKLFAKQRLSKKLLIAPLISTLVLAGCEEGLTVGGAEGLSTTGTTTETVEIDVVAPEAFSITDTAIWDGRPTFGGIWVAYPDIEQPERVRIRNNENGKEVIAGLYRREREFPGPKFQLSADAAAELGVLAGTPTELTIIALRRKVVEVAVEPEEQPEVETEVLSEPEETQPADDVTTPVRRPAEAVEVVAPAVEPVAPAAVLAPLPTADIVDIVESALPPVAEPTEADPNALAFYVQVATLKSKEKAEITVGKLTTAGLPVEIRER